MSTALEWIDEELQALDSAGLRRRVRTRNSSVGPRIAIDGRDVIDFSSNDYLGLAGDPRLVAAASGCLQETGWGSGASPLVTGRSAVHAELESLLATFEGTEAALLFPSGYSANTGSIAALVGPDDAVFSDAKNHASIIDGCRLSGARRFIYRHNDCEDLQRQLHDAASFRRRLIVSDTLFSMDGDVAPLAELADLAERYDAMLMVDEAHATGVFGATGRGVAEQAGVHERIAVRVGTLSKALGSAGGCVCGSRALIDWLANRARSYVFSTAQPAACAAAALEALDAVEAHPGGGRQLLAAAQRLRGRLHELGWSTGNSESQIVPLMVGDVERAVALWAALVEAGYLVPAIRPPSVPPGESLLRLSLTTAHTEAMLEGLLESLARL